jgi:hypothetical protein
MMKTNLLGTQPACETDYVPVCTDEGTLFGPKTGQTVHVSLREDEIIRLEAFTITALISFSIVDKNPGADCADCGTGMTIPYAPCNGVKELSTGNRVEYIKGPGVFELKSLAPAGVPYVKMTKIKSITEAEFCKSSVPACPCLTGASFNSDGLLTLTFDSGAPITAQIPTCP